MKAIIYADGRFRTLVPDDTITDPEFTRIWVEEKPPVPAKGNVVEEATPEVTATHAFQRWLTRPKSDPELASEADAADLVLIKAAHTALKAGNGTNAERITRLERILARVMKELWGAGLILAFALLGTSADAQTPTNTIIASVRLAWDPNPETDLAGYRVHRGIAPGTRLETRNVGLVTTNDWTGLLPGVTNYFTVTAYNTAGLESDPSNEIAYAVKAKPGSPAIASAVVTVIQTTVWTTITNTFSILP